MLHIDGRTGISVDRYGVRNCGSGLGKITERVVSGTKQSFKDNSVIGSNWQYSSLHL